MGEIGVKENGRMSEFKYVILINFCKFHTITSLSTTMKKKKKT
jgi:hypothetical protein